MKADRIAGVVATIAGLSLAVASMRIDVLANQPTLSARFFPYILAAVLCAGGLLLALKPGDASLDSVVDKLLARRGIIFAALFLVYALTFRFVDFRLGTWIFVLVAMWLLGSRKWIELLVLPLAIAVATYLLFRYGFTVLLPVWI